MKFWLQGCAFVGCLLLTLPCCAARKRVSRENPPETRPATTTNMNWESYSKALELSKQDHKPICLFFTGSDWCMWCIKMQQQILQTTDFKDFARKHLHMVEVDFPQKNNQSQEQRQKNQELKTQHKVTGFPELVFIDQEGKQLARMGFEPGGGAAYVTRVKSALKMH
ncbi:disulfide reductase DsbH [Candidatus Chlamydia corallus]|uniref:disulfide reductase DsbH n=1 Tax=Candidatus Chlamydia corallus TaxID=2038470 RepID=UPI000C2FEB8D|nr:disulfide reductase DsbH [Candidatus Chlamydia corallus]